MAVDRCECCVGSIFPLVEVVSELRVVRLDQEMHWGLVGGFIKQRKVKQTMPELELGGPASDAFVNDQGVIKQIFARAFITLICQVIPSKINHT
jgi:hypothetical protein